MTAAKPTLLLIHGWGFAADVWSPLRRLLEGDWQVRCLDLPGYAGGDAPASLESTADQLASSLPAATGATVVCGWSLGGLVAMMLAHRHPDKFSALALVSATPRFLTAADWPHAQSPATLDAFDRALSDDANALRNRFAALINQGDSGARDIRKALHEAIKVRTIPTATLATGLTQLRHGDLRHLAPALTLPTLLVHGAHDPLMPLAAARWLENTLPAARLDVFAHSAHVPFLSDPTRFATALNQFRQDHLTPATEIPAPC